MGRVFLIIGAVVGGLVFAFGALGLVVDITDPSHATRAGWYGAYILMAVGAAVAAPCFVFAPRIAHRSAPSWRAAESGTVPQPGGDLQHRYLAWFAWCQQTLSGDAVSLHAATMAAMAAAATENSSAATAAAGAEAARQTTRITTSGVMPRAPGATKVRDLSRLGASTVGLLEPSERVLVSFGATNRPPMIELGSLRFWLFGSIWWAIQMTPLFVTITDQRVIVLGASVLGGLANRVVLVEPRSTVSATFPKGIFGRRNFTLKGLSGGSVSMTVPRPWDSEALLSFELLAPPVGQTGS